MTKRPRNRQSISPEHPAVAFHREVLTVQQWSLIRQAFLGELQNSAKHGVAWKEPSKLWRHSQEALGKWVLSQIARVKQTGAGSGGDEALFNPSMAALHFFPTTADFAKFVPSGRAYDEQLIRDLSLKCENGAHDAAVIAKVKDLVVGFDMAKRCDAAHAAVEEQLAEALEYAATHTTPSQPFGQHLARPRLRRVEADDPARSPSQRRVDGPIAELAVQWPAHWSRSQTRHCPSVSIPWAAWQKLHRSYTYYNSSSSNNKAAAGGDAGGPHKDDDVSCDVFVPLTGEGSFLYRAAVVVLRYEGGLATGSLQLCADTSLKQHLHAQGYHLMDLCASPINAYMGVPATGRFQPHTTQATQPEVARPSSLEQEQEQPNYFCSAFLDTDRYFGSLGSALRVDPLALYRSTYVNPDSRPLLLTLDVPYDEDLCEMLFQKLIVDMARAEAATPAVRVDYILVLPLWWSIPMRIEKHLFRGGTQMSETSPAEQRAAVWEVVKQRSAMLAQGYQVAYHWPEDLAAASRDASHTPAEEGAPSPWVCFDGLFMDDSGYAYFCTATNRWLRGVTATEVIGLQQPRHGDDIPLLARSLHQYYLS